MNVAAARPACRLLEVRGLSKHFSIHAGFSRRVVGTFMAVDDVSFHIDDGETLALVGESGCGKTTTARCVLRAIEPTAGEMHFRIPDGTRADIAALSARELRQLRRHIQMIFQDPFSSLNPRMTLFDIVGEPLLNYGMQSRSLRKERVAELLGLVGLRPEYMSRFPHAFSGGQRQRIGIARALALNPRLVVADEAVSALDVSVQAQVLNLMMELREKFGLAYLFVAHDLSVVKHFSHWVAVMYLGRIVETGPTEALFARPRHPYTEALLSAVPTPDPRRKSRRIVLAGEVGNAVSPPSGCAFHPRCAYATEICRHEMPKLEEIAPGHMARCHHAPKLALAGAGEIAGKTRRP
ncbi:ABC transporter ATP-binding protein [Bradyrhizobium sp. BR 1432]|uniref:ABC transporter ATP-binding protein n=1 Tax=Bradyrhizobium sp. BR 1432 TaxID=3447966 RepID=UPI003EE6F28C